MSEQHDLRSIFLDAMSVFNCHLICRCRGRYELWAESRFATPECLPQEILCCGRRSPGSTVFGSQAPDLISCDPCGYFLVSGDLARELYHSSRSCQGVLLLKPSGFIRPWYTIF